MAKTSQICLAFHQTRVTRLVSYFRRYRDIFFGPEPGELHKFKPQRAWTLQGMRQFGNYYFYRTNNPECKELVEKIINRYGLNIGLDMHQKIYLVDDNFVADKIKELMGIQGEIGLTIKVGLFSGLRETKLCIYMITKYAEILVDAIAVVFM